MNEVKEVDGRTERNGFFNFHIEHGHGSQP